MENTENAFQTGFETGKTAKTPKTPKAPKTGQEMKIAPSMLASDFSRLGEELARIDKGGADWIHLDVMDGRFVPNITIGPQVIGSLRPYTNLPFDVHLMIVEPSRYIEKFVKAGADVLSFHVEAEKNVAETIERIRSMGARPGLVIKPGTPVSVLFPYLKEIDVVLVMTVEPGFGGQSFMEPMLEKVRELKKLAEKQALNFQIEIDGGVNEETIRKAALAGVDICVAGTGVFRHPDAGQAIRLLKNACREALS